MHDNEDLVRQLLQAGARGYILKSDARHHLTGGCGRKVDRQAFLAGRQTEQ
jgi:DNA-binding NarL/FixJ family response regulator